VFLIKNLTEEVVDDGCDIFPHISYPFSKVPGKIVSKEYRSGLLAQICRA
jgi:hypothetical protein